MTKNKKLTNCAACKEEIAKSAKSCPNCGKKNFKLNFDGWWWKVPLGLVGAMILFSGSSNGLPQCDSSHGIREAKRAFNQGPAAINFNITLKDIENPQEKSFDEENGFRVCKGIGYTNGGKMKLRYTFKGRGEGQYWIEIEESLSQSF